MRSRFVLAVATTVMAGCVITQPFTGSSSPKLTPAWTIAVAPAVEYVEQPRPSAFGEEVSRYLTEGLVASAPIRDVAWRFDGSRRVWDAASEQARRVRVPILALGQYTVTASGVTVNYRLVNESGFVIAAASETITSADQRVEVVRRLGSRLAELLRAASPKGAS